MNNFTAGDKVIRKSGKFAVGEIISIHGEWASVAWPAPNRINGSGYHHTDVKLTSLIPYSAAAAQARKKAIRINRLEKDMKRYYSYFKNAPDVETQLTFAIKLSKLEIQYSTFAYGGEQHEYGVCSKCQRERILLSSRELCGTCWHREARRINTKEMYGRGRRGY